MSQYVGVEPKQYPAIHCSPAVLVEALTPAIDPETLAGMVNSEKATAKRRPNPANGAPKPPGYNPVA